VVLSGLVEAGAEYREMNVQFRVKPIQPEDLIELVHTLIFPSYSRTA
jgi:hypothetical protein